MLSILPITVLLFVAADPDPTKRLRPPVVRFPGSTRGGALAFEVTNPNAVPVSFLGYWLDPLNKPKASGKISPLYAVEVRRGGKWKLDNQGWCGTGAGRVSVAPKGRVTFTARPPEGKWEAVRIGLRLCRTPGQRNEPRITVWSKPIPHQAVVTPKKP